MVVTIYLMRKAGEPRVYTNTVGFDEAQKVALKKEGFELFKVYAELPDDIEAHTMKSVERED